MSSQQLEQRVGERRPRQEQEQLVRAAPYAVPCGAKCALMYGAPYGAWIYGLEASGTSFLAEGTLDYCFGYEGGDGINCVGLVDEASVHESAYGTGGDGGF